MNKTHTAMQYTAGAENITVQKQSVELCGPGYGETVGD